MQDIKARIRSHLVRAFGVIFAIGVVLSLSPVTAKADVDGIPTRDISQLKGTITYYLGTDWQLKTYFEAKSGTITNVKSSNPKVVRATRDTYPWAMYLTPRKAGTSIVTCKYKGKTYKAKIVVKNWANPVKQLSIGGKNYASKFTRTAVTKRGSTYGYAIDVKTLKGKLKITPASGWKIASIRYGKFEPTGAFCNYRSIKNGSTIKSCKRYDRLSIFFRNTKTGGYERIDLNCYY